MSVILLSTPLCLELLQATEELLEARSNQMLTSQEWSRVRKTVVACGERTLEEEVDDQEPG